MKNSYINKKVKTISERIMLTLGKSFIIKTAIKEAELNKTL